MQEVPIQAASAQVALGALDDVYNQVCGIQGQVNDRVNELLCSWTDRTATVFLRGYAAFDREITSVLQSLEVMHAVIAGRCAS